MTVKDLQSVLCGNVTLYEPVPGGYKELYCGMSQKIPEELQSREVHTAGPMPRRGKGPTIEIQLKTALKKAQEKSPA